jgi:hypothetical protein
MVTVPGPVAVHADAAGAGAGLPPSSASAVKAGPRLLAMRLIGASSEEGEVEWAVSLRPYLGQSLCPLPYKQNNISKNK